MIEGYKKIVVGIDGSVEATKAFEKAITIAKTNDAELILVNVIDLRAYQSLSTYGGAVLADDTQKGAENLIDDYANEAKQAGLHNIRKRVEFGSPKTLLGITIPTEEKADLIVLGATGLSYIERVFIGSVAQYIINRAPCDTLIVRH